jgi:hypothetical protein
MQLLLATCTRLCSKGYVDINGAATMCLVGAKGIGKSTALKFFAAHAGAWFENLHFAFVDLSGTGNPVHPLRSSSLMVYLFSRFMPLDAVLSLASLKKLDPALLEHWLQTRNEWMVLLVDELDELYRAVPVAEEVLHATLNELAYFGNSKSGRVAVLLCGSSATIPSLIKHDGVPMLYQEFPTLKGAPNMNGTKYSCRRLYSPTPVDLKMVERIVPNMSTLDRKRLLFSVGPNRREILKYKDTDSPPCDLMTSKMSSAALSDGLF